MLRVAFIDQTGGGTTGGAQESLLLLLRHLPPQVQPHVLFFEDGPLAGRVRALGIPVAVVPLPAVLAAASRDALQLGGLAAAPAVILRVARVLRAWRVDVVHTNTVKAHFLGAPGARLAGVPTVAHLRDLLDGAPRVALSGVMRGCVRDAISISAAVARWYHLGASTVIANPVELDRYAVPPDRARAKARLGLPPNVPAIGIVGRINRWKGHDRFLRIAAALRARGPVHAVIVGEARFRDADFVPELHALAATLGLRADVSFVPWTDDVREAYAALDVNCNCSTREPFGRTTIEAAAMGVPTVAFDDGGAEDTIVQGVTGAIVPAGDDGAFAAALRGYLEDDARLAQAGTMARALAQRFAADVHAARVAAVLARAAA